MLSSATYKAARNATVTATDWLAVCAVIWLAWAGPAQSANAGVERCSGTIEKDYVHNLMIKTSDGLVNGFDYSSIDGEDNSCEVSAGRGDRQSQWADFGDVTIVRFDSVGGEPGNNIRIEKKSNGYVLSVWSWPAPCGTSGYLSPFVRLINGRSSCILEDAGWDHVFSIYKDALLWDSLVSLVPSGATPDFGYSLDVYDRIYGGAGSVIAAQYHEPDGVAVAINKGHKHYDTLLNYASNGARLEGVWYPPRSDGRKSLIGISETSSARKRYDELKVVGRSVRVSRDTMVPARGNVVYVSRRFDSASGTRTMRAAPHAGRVVRFNLIRALQTRESFDFDSSGVANKWVNVPRTTVDDKVFVYFHPKRWRGPKDLSFKAQAQWDANALYLRVRVKDDHVIQPFDGDKMLNGDHVELWVGRDHPRQFALSALARSGDPQAIRQWYPNDEAGPVPGAKAAGRRTADGYVVEAELPLAVLGLKAPPSDAVFTRHTRPVPFTVVVSDTDNAKSPRQDKAMASSQLTWGDADTFGELYLVRHAGLPLFEAKNGVALH